MLPHGKIEDYNEQIIGYGFSYFRPGPLALRAREAAPDGARFDITAPLKVFEIVTLKCGDTKINRLVAWSEKGRLGIEFSELLTRDVLVDSLKGRINVSGPKGSATGLFASSSCDGGFECCSAI